MTNTQYDDLDDEYRGYDEEMGPHSQELIPQNALDVALL
nr:hypothetical protein [Tanacetum cinerariifolium]